MAIEWLGFARLIQPVLSVYERIVGKAPHADFEPGDDGVKLRVHNPRTDTIIIEKIRAEPPLLAFSTGPETYDIARAIAPLPNEPVTVVQPQKSVELPLITLHPFDTLPPTTSIKVTVYWRSSSRGMFSKSTVKRKITVRDIGDLKFAVEQRAPRIRFV